jgi:hypothetical protein
LYERGEDWTGSCCWRELIDVDKVKILLGSGEPFSETVPFEGACETTSTSTPIGPGKLRAHVNGQCQFTHLGRTQFFADQISDFVAGALTGSNVFIAGNGG